MIGLLVVYALEGGWMLVVGGLAAADRSEQVSEGAALGPSGWPPFLSSRAFSCCLAPSDTSRSSSNLCCILLPSSSLDGTALADGWHRHACTRRQHSEHEDRARMAMTTVRSRVRGGGGGEGCHCIFGGEGCETRAEGAKAGRAKTSASAAGQRDRAPSGRTGRGESKAPEG